MDIKNNRLQMGGCDAEALAGEFGTPLYVYEGEVIRQKCKLFQESFAGVPLDIHYALKANCNPGVLAIIRDEGLCIDAVSPFEVQFCLELGFAPDRIIFTPNNTSEEELRLCLEQGVPVNVGSLAELDIYGRLNSGGQVALRINPDVGAGHHHHVITGGPHSKFGIYHTEATEIQQLLNRHKLRLTGIHSHIGTGILKTEHMLQAMEIILATARQFEHLEFIDFGGGFGIPYRPGEKGLPLPELGKAMGERFARFCEQYGRELRMKLEPGRWLVAQAGTLLVRVTNIQSTPAHIFVGTDSGFNHLLRPTIYGAYHHIVNASQVEGEQQAVVVAGNICESGDVFTPGEGGPEDRPISRPEIGHLLALRDTGAYGMVLASNYNMRARPAEVVVQKGEATLTRRRETYEDVVAMYEGLPQLTPGN
jgi:diaminopimelate decarboxylase